MANASHINVGSTTYDICDAVARGSSSGTLLKTVSKTGTYLITIFTVADFDLSKYSKFHITIDSPAAMSTQYVHLSSGGQYDSPVTIDTTSSSPVARGRWIYFGQGKYWDLDLKMVKSGNYYYWNYTGTIYPSLDYFVFGSGYSTTTTQTAIGLYFQDSIANAYSFTGKLYGIA